MKRLILVRHGKSSWEHDLPDVKRPLKKRATKDAKVVSAALKGAYSGPSKLWTSPAKRAYETAKMFKKALDIPDKDFEVVKDLYTFDASELQQVIKSCPDEVNQLFVFGHNPAMTNAMNRLGDKKLDNLPTTGLCMIDFAVDSWSEISRGQTILTLLPKNLR